MKIENEIDVTNNRIPVLHSSEGVNYTFISGIAAVLPESVVSSGRYSDYLFELPTEETTNYVVEDAVVHRNWLQRIFGVGKSQPNYTPRRITTATARLVIKKSYRASITFKTNFLVGGLLINDAVVTVTFMADTNLGSRLSLDLISGNDPVWELCCLLQADMALKVLGLNWERMETNAEFAEEIQAVCNSYAEGSYIHPAFIVQKVQVALTLPVDVEQKFRNITLKQLESRANHLAETSAIQLRLNTAELLGVKSQMIKMYMSDPIEWKKYLQKIFVVQHKMMDSYKREWEENQKIRRKIFEELLKFVSPEDAIEKVSEMLELKDAPVHSWMYRWDELE
ncbi:MAG: hypothetical protein AAF998_02155 [Bacteroidota bacterium]